MKTLLRRPMLSGALSAALVAGLLTLGGTGAAHAADPDLNSAFEVKDGSGNPVPIVVSPTSGNGIGSSTMAIANVATGLGAAPTVNGVSLWCTWGVWLISADGTQMRYRGGSASSCNEPPTTNTNFSDALRRGEAWTTGSLSVFNQTGGLLPWKPSTGSPWQLTVNSGSNPKVPTGNYRLVVAGFPWSPTTNGVVPDRITDRAEYRYWQIGFKWTQGATDAQSTWAFVPVSELGTTPAKADTSTTVTASDVMTTGVTLTATVSPSAATGSVTFKQGANTLGTGTITSGVATYNVTGLNPGTTYGAGAFTAEYAGDATHNGSSGSSASFNTLAPADTSSSDVTLSVPTAETPNPSGDLTISVKPGAITLVGGARTTGADWSATGALGNVAVLDDRRNAAGAAWSLSGSASAFTGSGTAAGQTIPASALSWAGATGGTGFQAGALDQARVLSTGAASAATDVLTTITGTQLTLVVPSGKTAGAYAGTLTLTLI